MQRVLIFGASGAGKTVLAFALGRATGLPVVHLDPLFYDADWERLPLDPAEAALTRISARERWILDGNFFGSPARRFERADTVVLLDLPRRCCIWRIVRRRIVDRGRSRPDLPVGGREKLDLGLLRWVWSYRRRDLRRLLDLVAAADPPPALRHLRSPRDVRCFLASLPVE